MYLDAILALNKKFQKTRWENIKHGTTYQIVAIAYDATNSREGTPVVIYQKAGYGFGIFVRDFDEFMQKFHSVK